ncbi:MAG: carbon starvation protein A [Deltaproteobacteria bacterium]|nr:carbon starvation protein A [Deltaproteobacteria bacterium]MCB9788369.1 carbon starvation protein A [Deltaproteobacteria bacterium]
MNAAHAAAAALAAYLVGYFVYSRFLANRVFGLRPDAVTPAHALEDGVDFVPTRRGVLFGHHYASIAGLSPVLGPAVAVIWGWLPALTWVVLGALLIGCVHDFGALVLSVRARGVSIGKVAEGIIGKRAKTLFHLIIFFLVALGMGVFVYVIAFLFRPATGAEDPAIHFPQAVLPSAGLMLIAAAVGWLGYRRGLSWRILTPLGFGLLLALVWLGVDQDLLATLGTADPARAPGQLGWSLILLAYAFAAAVLPVWSLLQPRDFLNSLLLYVGLGGLFAGIFVLQPAFVAPALRPHPEGAPSLFPFVFIVIACGAASGFHSLVSSGTTAKQLDRETDARLIGYGGMIGESLLGLIAVLATTAGLLSADEWSTQYATWDSVKGLGAQVGAFIHGSSTFLAALGIERYAAASFISLIVVSYALTSLDSATRLLRYNLEEMGETMGIGLLRNRYVSAALAVGAIAVFAFLRLDGKPAGLALWALFGTTNQLLAGLALLAITLYLLRRGRLWVVTAIPMVLLLSVTLWAMAVNIVQFYQDQAWLLLAVGSLLLVLGVWLVIEAALSVLRFRRSGARIEGLDIALPG